MNNSQRLNRLGIGVFERNDQRKEKYKSFYLRKNKPPLLDLSLGSSDLLPPAIVIEEIKKSLSSPLSSSYSLHAATKPFREAVATWCTKRFGIEINPEKEVLLLVGSQEGTAHLPLAVLNSGDSGLIMDPSYPSHRGGLILADAHIEKLLLNADDRWKPNFDSLTNSKWDQLKMMIFGFPHNPTAQVGEQSWLEEAVNRGLKHDLVIAHDNPYLDLALEGEAPALLRCNGWRECGIEFFSFSKAWCMGGLRLGFAVGAEKLIKALKEIKGVIDFNQSLALQNGAITALNESLEWPNNILEIYRERRDRTINSFKEFGWEIPNSSMALYLWMPIPNWASNRGWSDEQFAINLLEETGVALTPGSGFGMGGKAWLRLALVRPVKQLEEAVSRIKPWWNANS